MFKYLYHGKGKKTKVYSLYTCGETETLSDFLVVIKGQATKPAPVDDFKQDFSRTEQRITQT